MISLKKIKKSEIQKISEVLFKENVEYLKYFDPFESKEQFIKDFSKSSKDVYLKILNNNTFIGFVTLRGLDDGYKNPRFGIFIMENTLIWVLVMPQLKKQYIFVKKNITSKKLN